MSQTSYRPARKTPSKLDRAIVFSIAAMAAMNVFVLAQQIDAAPQVADAAAASVIRA